MIKITRGIEKKDITKQLGSAELVEDANGDLYLSYTCHNAATGLLHVGEQTLIASNVVAFPVTRCPKGTAIKITI